MPGRNKHFQSVDATGAGVIRIEPPDEDAASVTQQMYETTEDIDKAIDKAIHKKQGSGENESSIEVTQTLDQEPAPPKFEDSQPISIDGRTDTNLKDLEQSVHTQDKTGEKKKNQAGRRYKSKAKKRDPDRIKQIDQIINNFEQKFHKNPSKERLDRDKKNK